MQTAMEIVRDDSAACPELTISGRLDSYWARHVSEAIDELMREGSHHARLNLSKTSYISSAGIRVLVQAYQQFTAVGGSFVVIDPSAPVRHILELAGLGTLMSAPAGAQQARPEPTMRAFEEAGCAFEVYPYAPGARLSCRITGDPDRLISDGFSERECEMLALPRDTISLGLGAFGDGYADGRDRCGEFVAVAGCAACQLTDEAGYADYMVGAGELVPRIASFYTLSCRGKFETFLRFDTTAQSGPASLSSIVGTCMKTCEARIAGIVIVAESAGVMGASLKHSPAAPHGTLFHHPEVRQWLSFSPVRSYTRSVLLVAGVAAQTSPPAVLAPFVRPLNRNSPVSGHFHAAVFAYRPLRKGYLDLDTAVAKLFDGGGLECVLHLLADDRTAANGTETEIARGACWIGPISELVSPEATS